MFRSFKLGTAFGIPLYIHSTFLLLPLTAIFLSRSAGLTGILFSQSVLLSIFACVLLHELGHALMARVFGITTRDITLYPIGGVARLEGMGRGAFEEICIALAGPAVNLVLIALLSPVVVLLLLSGGVINPEVAIAQGGGVSLFSNYLVMLWAGNLVLLLFNLIPAFPMDGGRVFRAILSIGLGQLRATEIAAALGLVLAAALGIAGIVFGNLSLTLVAVFVGIAGRMELQSLRRYEAQKRLATDPSLDVVVPVSVPQETGGFTGFVWDRNTGVWVRWVNGQPVEVC
jgi:Zn-dependent protease